MSRRTGLAVAAVTAALVLPGCSLQDTRQGCPPGAHFENTSLVFYCDAPNGSTVCIRWAAGFTPNPQDQQLAQTYTRGGVPGVGRWCGNATSPPPGV